MFTPSQIMSCVKLFTDRFPKTMVAVLLSWHAGGGGSAFTTTQTISFDQAVSNLDFFLLDADDALGSWGDSLTITAFNGATPVTVTYTPNTPANYTISGATIESVGGAYGSSSEAANVLVTFGGPVTSFTIDYAYGSGVTAGNPGLQVLGIGDWLLMADSN